MKSLLQHTNEGDDMERSELNQAIQTQLEKSGIGFEEIKVFGVLRCNVHVVCMSRETAQKWVSLLQQGFKGAKVTMSQHVFNAKQNKNTVLKPTVRKGFLVGMIY
jgi:hypothetical protein